ncbi:MAG: hypothetical protein AAF664_17070 [Planctomycetota bacterium]
MLTGPRNSNGFHPTLLALRARSGSLDLGGELHGVEVTPFAFGSLVRLATSLAALRANQRAASRLDLNADAIACQIEVDIVDNSRTIQAMQRSIVFVEIVHP